MAIQSQAQPRTAAPAFNLGEFLRNILDNYLLQRLIRAILTVWVIATLSFFLFRLMPGNPIDIAVNDLVINQSMPLELARQQVASLYSIDLNRPVYLQYFDFLGNLLHGSLGFSYVKRGLPVSAEIINYLPWTLFSVGLGLLISFVIGIALGTLIAYQREGIADHILSFLGSILTGIPVGVLVLIMIVALAPNIGVIPKITGGLIQVDWTQVRGAYSPNIVPGFTWQFITDVLYHAIVPVLTYVFLNISSWMLTMKSNTVSTLEEDYVNVARAKGLGDGRIATAYVGRNAILPMVTQFTLALAFSIGGSALIERYFVYRGIGGELGAAVGNRDYPVMQGIFLVLAIVTVFGNLLTDLLYGVIDPRIRIKGGRR